MSYVDGFVLTVPTENLGKYKEISSEAGKIWMKHGAVSYMECAADDMEHDWCKLPFPKLTDCGADETIVFAFIVFKSREDRDRINEAVMQDPAMKDAPEEMPFAMEKMAYGGFEAIVEY